MKVGILGYLNNSGLGVMTRTLIEQLGIERHLVCDGEDKGTLPELALAPDTRISRTWTPSPQEVQDFLDGLDAVVTVETDYRTGLGKLAQKRGVRAVFVPMWEWWDAARYHGYDLYVCTSRESVRRVQGVPDAAKLFLPWPVDTERFAFRERTCSARTFVHAAGHGGLLPWRRKGTRYAVLGFARAKARLHYLELVVHSIRPLEYYDEETQAAIRAPGSGITFLHHELPVPEAVYAEGQVYLYTARLDGQSMVAQEAQACGMPTIATDAPPMNEYTCNPAFLVRVAGCEYAEIMGRPVEVWTPDVDDVARAILLMATSNLGPASRDARTRMQVFYSWAALRERWREAIVGAKRVG